MNLIRHNCVGYCPPTGAAPAGCVAGRLAGVREWLVGGALVEAPTGVLLVRNVRRGGATDWSTPGGVIDAEDASLLAGLTREVAWNRFWYDNDQPRRAPNAEPAEDPAAGPRAGSAE